MLCAELQFYECIAHKCWGHGGINAVEVWAHTAQAKMSLECMQLTSLFCNGCEKIDHCKLVISDVAVHAVGVAKCEQTAHQLACACTAALHSIPCGTWLCRHKFLHNSTLSTLSLHTLHTVMIDVNLITPPPPANRLAAFSQEHLCTKLGESYSKHSSMYKCTITSAGSPS